MKIRRVTIIILLNLILLTNMTYAKYRYYFEETIIELTRNANAPICNISYSTEEITNQNVIVTITSNKEIEQVSGFELSEDKKILTKEVIENESKNITVRDFSGNCTQLEYQVNNIDKEAPEIIGCEDGKTYFAPLMIDYKDNQEIKNVSIEKYQDKLTLEYQNIYYDCADLYGIGRTKSQIEIKVKEHPFGTKRYKYYINDELYATTSEKQYIFTKLNKGTVYKVKVQAIDSLGNVLDEKEMVAKTSYYNTIISSKTKQDWKAEINEIDDSVSKISYAVWNIYDEKNTIWQNAQIVNQKAQIDFTPFCVSLYPAYVIHAYLYDTNNEVMDIIEFSIDFATNYEKKEKKEENLYEIIEAGNYQIKVTDFAGNETSCHIKIE